MVQVCDPAVALLNSGEILLNCMAFKATFNKEREKRKDFKSITAATSSRSALLRGAAGQESEGVTDMAAHIKLCGEDLELLSTVHVFGYKGSALICGPDLHCLGSLRATCENSGMRVVIAVALSSAQVAVAKR